MRILMQCLEDLHNRIGGDNLMSKKEKAIIILIILLGSLWCTCSVYEDCNKNKKSKVSWLNDNVYYTTNLVMDTERNKTLPTNSTQVYVFPIVSTNRINPTYILINGKVSELGGREDGVLVWRIVKK